jgi:hypothetical protein
VSTQVNFEVKLLNTGSIRVEYLENAMQELKWRLENEANKFLAELMAVPPPVVIRGPVITFLAD